MTMLEKTASPLHHVMSLQLLSDTRRPRSAPVSKLGCDSMKRASASFAACHACGEVKFGHAPNTVSKPEAAYLQKQNKIWCSQQGEERAAMPCGQPAHIPPGSVHSSKAHGAPARRHWVLSAALAAILVVAKAASTRAAVDAAIFRGDAVQGQH